MNSGFLNLGYQEQSTELDYNELMRGHDVMITAPNELAQMLKAVDKGK